MSSQINFLMIFFVICSIEVHSELVFKNERFFVAAPVMNLLPNARTKQFIYSRAVGQDKRLIVDVVKPIKNVEILQFRDNGLTEMEPDALKTLKQLTVLSFVGNKLCLSNGALDDLPLLVAIEIAKNPMNIVKRGMFGRLKNLKSLELVDNNIESLEDNVFDNLTSLKELRLRANLISHIPSDIFKNLPNLQLVDLAHNKLWEIPNKLLDGTSVETIILINNSISQLPKNCFKDAHKLQKIFLTENKITSIQKGAFSGSNLVKIDISQNHILQLDTESFTDLPKLEEVILNVNQLTQYNPNWFHNTPNMKYLEVSDNLIEEINTDVCKNMQNNERKTLEFNSNKIKKIAPDAFKNCKSFYNVGFAYNELEDWNEGLLRDIKEVDLLFLAGNKIKCLKGDLGQIFKGEFTYLGDNPLEKECRVSIEKWVSKNASHFAYL